MIVTGAKTLHMLEQLPKYSLNLDLTRNIGQIASDSPVPDMPTYRAAGITASLFVADLEEAITKPENFSIRQRTDDVERVLKVFEQRGKKLREQAINTDRYGSSNTSFALQYIGSDNDMPLLMVEAGKHIRTDDRERPIVPSTESSGIDLIPLAPLNAHPSQIDNLTACPLASAGVNPSCVNSSASRLRRPTRDTPSNILDHAPHTHAEQSAVQALMLTVHTTFKTHICGSSYAGARNVPHVKTEILLNGKLVDLAMVNPRRGSIPKSTDVNPYWYFGTRFHRQLEKPWVYQTSETFSGDTMTAQERWKGLGDLLREEAGQRDFYSPGAQYLYAISNVRLPDSFAERAHFGVIDVIVTTGEGMKLNDGPFISSPTRMRSTTTCRPSWQHLAAAPLAQPAQASEPHENGSSNKSSHKMLPETLNESAVVRSNTAGSSASVEKSDAAALAEELGISLEEQKTIIQYNPTRSVGGKRKSRTVRRRLNDIRHMSSRNRDASIEQLLKDLGKTRPPLSLPSSKAPHSSQQTSKVNVTSEGSPRPKSVPLESRLDYSHQPAPLPPQALSSEVSSDLPMSEGATLPFKSPREQKKLDSQTLSDSHTNGEAAKAFEVSRLCQGSAVSYAGGNMQRQVKKVKRGEFTEAALVAGIRFLVI